jgi:GNAT superfamily N-acetyltransferase
MTNARIVIVGPGEYQLICDLYNEIFRPAADAAYFLRRLKHRHNVLTLVAELEGRPVGFSCGYELRPSTYYTWLYGVLPDARRLGIGSQLMAAEHAWARDHGYEMARFECYNDHRPILLLAIKNGFNIVGIRWDSHTSNNHVIFEKNLLTPEE